MTNGGCVEGYFASFEGQDGCGKTTVIRGVAERLCSLGHRTHTIGEFSQAHFGDYLLHALSEDKFLRVKAGHKTSLTQAFAVLTDLMYLTEYEIMPKLAEGNIVLKDRYVDTLLACQLPAVLEEYGAGKGHLYEWFAQVAAISPAAPDTTFYLDVPLDVRIKRIQERDRAFKEHRANEVSSEDVRVFGAREQAYRRIAADNPKRFKVIGNARDIESTVGKITEAILGGYGKSTG